MEKISLFFCISIFVCGWMLYITARLHFSDERNQNAQLKSLFFLGMIIFSWLFLGAISPMIAEPFYPFVYTLRMIALCLFPYALLWFALSYSNVRLLKSSPLRVAAITLASADVLALVTNPLHKQYFTAYTYPISAHGPLFTAHAISSYVIVFLAYAILFWHIIRHIKQNPWMLLAGLGIVLPYIYNILYLQGLFGDSYNLTALLFSFFFIAFAWLSYKSNFLALKTIAFSKVFFRAKEMVAIFDTQGVFIDVNQAFEKLTPGWHIVPGSTTLLDFQYEAFKHNEMGEHDPTLVKLGDFYHSLTRTGRSELSEELSYRNADGQTRTFTLDIRPFSNRKKVTAGYIMSLTDVSDYQALINKISLQNKELVVLKEEAEQASLSKSLFLSNMSHEIRTPLNVIIGMASLVLQTDDDAKRNDYMHKIDTASKHLLGVINDVLDISKIESGKLQLVKEAFSLRQAIFYIEEMFRHTTQQKGQQFKIEIAKEIPEAIVGDRQRITQVITNLISNAIKFTPAGGSITLRAFVVQDDGDACTLRVEVSDTGIGISKEQQKRLFTSFVQADESVSRRFGGTGLGLAISKRIVELSGGEIGVHSKENEGSTFYFVLPTIKCQKAFSQEKALEVQADMFKNRAILLAEDVPMNQEIITAFLEKTGIQIDYALNGNEAVALFREHPAKYSAILMDIQMPQKDGYQATRDIRAGEDEWSKQIPIIAMTANVFREDIDRCLACGMNAHLGKPVDANELIGVLQSYFK